MKARDGCRTLIRYLPADRSLNAAMEPNVLYSAGTGDWRNIFRLVLRSDTSVDVAPYQRRRDWRESGSHPVP